MFPVHSLLNQTLAVNTSGITPRFRPSIYALSNELINNSYSYKNLLYPILTQYTVKNEQQFFQVPQKILINCPLIIEQSLVNSIHRYNLSFSTVGMNKMIILANVTLQNLRTKKTTQVSVTLNRTNPKKNKNMA